MRPSVVFWVSVPTIAWMIASCSDGARSQLSSGDGGALSGDGGPDLDGSIAFDVTVTTCTAPQTCAAANASCGPIGDGCDGVLECGACVAPETCGGGGEPSVCGGDAGCVPLTCADASSACGQVGDGCGGLLDCGGCPAPETCGGGGTPGLCGGTGPCVPRTCAAAGANCGPVADGCGGLVQCGACLPPGICGGGSAPSVCGGEAPDAGACTNLCLRQVTCDGGATTTVSGVVYAPNGVDPLYNAVVYVPNAAVAPFPPGVACEQCGAAASGSPLVSVITGPDGKFLLTDVPTGPSVPLVIQIGRWRRQIIIPSVTACANTALPADLTRLPRNQGEGDIPLMALATGSVDALECVLRKIGIDDTEFTVPAGQGGAGRVNLYLSNGSTVGPATPVASQLYGSLAALSAYDMVLFPCEGGQIDKPLAAQDNVIQYANAGGRVFTTHYSYVWLYDDPPFSTTASFAVNQNPLPDLTGYLDTSFPKGKALAQWLVDVGASTSYGQIPLHTIRHDVNAVVAPSQLWIAADPQVSANAVMHYTFNTPVGAAPLAQCGRVLFDDFHVEDAPTAGVVFPDECTGGAMTPQEKLLEFMLFDLASCITPDVPPPPSCQPRTCAQQGASCGPAGDGCGGQLDCGTCPGTETCGGGGTPSACGGATCTPLSCAAQGLQCGPSGDGCGGDLDCGPCPTGLTCGGGGTPGVCGAPKCAARTCADLGAACGPVADGCGGLLMCGECAPPQTCGGGGVPSVCGSLGAN